VVEIEDGGFVLEVDVFDTEGPFSKPQGRLRRDRVSNRMMSTGNRRGSVMVIAFGGSEDRLVKGMRFSLTKGQQ
jgi:hypothetical protein